MGRNLFDTVFEGMQILQNILTSSHSVLCNISNYHIYFVSEASHIQAHPAPNRTIEFDFFRDSFPKGKVTIRVDHEQYIEDFDILTSSHMYVSPTGTTFGVAQFDMQEPRKTTVITPWNKQVSWAKLLALNAEEFVRFNHLYCCSNSLKWMEDRCRSKIAAIKTSGVEVIPCEELQEKALLMYG
jgi:hypothetical protein